jgi:GntR family transcriptional regulator
VLKLRESEATGQQVDSARGFEYKPANLHYTGQMDHQRTTAQPSLSVQIADDLRISIERGDLMPGDALPTLAELETRYLCSMTTARNAIKLLKQQGLIVGGRGRAPEVRTPPRQVERSSDRHQAEKDLVQQPEEIRAAQGLTESDLGTTFDKIEFEPNYSVVKADSDLASVFRVDVGESLLQREYIHRHKRSGVLEAWSLSWLPVALIRENPKISDPKNAAWPGGTMHQLYTVGIEIDTVIDEVRAVMPTTVDVQKWNLADGIPLLSVRRISLDTMGRIVEVSDAQYPADRTKLTFRTPLKRWESK